MTQISQIFLHQEPPQNVSVSSVESVGDSLSPQITQIFLYHEPPQNESVSSVKSVGDFFCRQP